VPCAATSAAATTTSVVPSWTAAWPVDGRGRRRVRRSWQASPPCMQAVCIIYTVRDRKEKKKLVCI
jgi:hypothetical protein